MSHPARIAILKVLAQKNECICGEIVEILPLAQSTVSQHLKALKGDLIKGTVDGLKVVTVLTGKHLKNLMMLSAVYLAN
jgi:DNA-binding transcriptional ArsR family regulator